MRPHCNFEWRKPRTSGHGRTTDRKIGKRYAIRITTGRGTETYHSDHIAETLLELLEKLKRQGIAVLDIEIDRGTLEQDFLEIARGHGE